MNSKQTKKRGHGAGGAGKTVVMGLLQRHASASKVKVKVKRGPNAKRPTIQGEIRRHVPSRPLAKEFARLVKQWDEETFSLSSLTTIYGHPAYQKIMAMGTEGLSLVLKELQKNKGHWFYALKLMAGKDGKDVAAGLTNFEDAKAAWLAWGYKNNYI